MPREMLKDLIRIVEPHKEENPELFKYLMMAWTACNFDSTLYACNITGMTISQRHLSIFDDEYERFYDKTMKIYNNDIEEILKNG